MIKLLRFDNFFPSLPDDIFVKTRSRMTTAIMFSRQNDAGCTCTGLSIQKMSEIFSSQSKSSQNLINKSKSRVLSRIHRFGKKSRVCTFIDHRNDFTIFKTQVEPLIAKFSLNILTSFLQSIRVKTMERWIVFGVHFC